MRLSLAALILLIAACTPPRTDAPSASQDKTATVGAAAPASAQLESTNAAILSAPPIDAVWSWNVDDSDGTALASLAYPLPPDRPPSPSRRGAVFTIICSPNDDSVSVFLGHNIAAGGDTTIRIITATQTVDIPAHSDLAGFSSALLDGADPRLDALRGPQRVFALAAEGETRVVVWDQTIDRLFTYCGV